MGDCTVDWDTCVHIAQNITITMTQLSFSHPFIHLPDAIIIVFLSVSPHLPTNPSFTISSITPSGLFSWKQLPHIRHESVISGFASVCCFAGDECQTPLSIIDYQSIHVCMHSSRNNYKCFSTHKYFWTYADTNWTPSYQFCNSFSCLI